VIYINAVGTNCDDEEEIADEPVSVSGAYLTCDWIDPEQKDSGATASIGCAVEDQNGNAFDRDQRNFALTLHGDDDTRVAMTTSEAPAGSRWHQLAELPRTHRTIGYVKMIVKKGNAFEGSFTQKTADIGTNTSLGNVLEGVPIPLGETDSIVLKSITVHSSWEYPPLLFALGFSADDFCDADGNLKTDLSETTVDSIDIANNKYKTKFATKNTIADTVVRLGGGKCFHQFEMIKSGKEFVHQISGGKCFVLDSGKVIHTISVGKDPNPNLTLGNLLQFATRQQCDD